MTWATFTTPGDLLKAMLVACQPVRALMANPGATWEEIAAILDAGTVAAGSTEDRIRLAVLDEEPDDEDFLEKPRATLRQLNDSTYTRSSTTGFNHEGTLSLLIELDIPESLEDDRSGAIRDAQYKQDAIGIALMSLAPQAGYLDLSGMTAEPVGLSDPTQHSEGDERQYQVMVFRVPWRS